MTRVACHMDVGMGKGVRLNLLDGGVPRDHVQWNKSELSCTSCTCRSTGTFTYLSVVVPSLTQKNNTMFPMGSGKKLINCLVTTGFNVCRGQNGCSLRD